MIHYYTYYSIGGYKDMYLGNSGQHNGKRYFLPLLAHDKEQADETGDKALLNKVERQSALPRIELLTNVQRFELPIIVTNKITTQGGYNLIYTHIEGDKYVIVFRGITGKDKDESGRPTPFLMVFMSDAPSDLAVMNCMACWIAQNESTAKQEIASFLFFDPYENGLCFEEDEMNAWVNKFAAERNDNKISLVDGTQAKISAVRGNVALLVTSESITPIVTLNKLDIGKYGTNLMIASKIIPQDNPALASKYREAWEEKKASKSRKYRLISMAAVAVVVIIVFIALISKCSGQSN